MKAVSIIILAVLISVAVADDCPHCWDKCFPQKLSTDEYIFYRLINKVRAAKIASDISLTSFMMDGSASPAIWDYQRHLAALIALTIPINKVWPSTKLNNCQNEFHTSIYHSHFAYFAWSWQCQDKCDVSKTLRYLPLVSAQTSPNWLGGSCTLAALTPGASWGIPCQVASPKRMAVAMMNNNVQTGTCSNTQYAVRVAVKVAAPTSPPAGFVLPTITPAPAYSLEIDASYTANRIATLKNLIKCISATVCGIDFAVRASQPADETYQAMLEGAAETETFRGIGQDELMKKLLNYRPSVDATKARKSA